MAKMTKMQEFYLKNNLNLNDAELVKVTGLTLKTVQRFRDKNRVDFAEAPPVENTVIKSTPAVDPDNLFIRNKKGGAAIMTEAASMAADDSVKRNIKASVRFPNPAIHTIKKNKK